MAADATLRVCPCGEELEVGFQACPSCGRSTSTGLETCPSCTQPIKPKWKVCPYCQAALSGWVTPTGPLPGSGALRSGELPNAEPGTGAAQIFVSQVDARGTIASGRYSAELPIIPGDVLADRYTVRQALGAGGFGSVYLVDDAVLSERRALKIAVVADEKADSAKEQILHEFKLRERITDMSHILRSEDPRPCEYKGLSLVLLPMELADGGSLRSWLATNRDVKKRRDRGLTLFKQACLGVGAIHKAGLVHLDVKPENILLVKDQAKVTDFGIGRFAGGSFADNPEQLLRQGIGTPQYMSPEQFRTARQKDVGPASDVYSLGLVLYELLDGALPFDGNPHELRDKHLNLAPAALKGEAAKWWPIVQRCLAKDPEQRYSDVTQLVGDLERADRGAALSVDVACASCGHINENKRRQDCENCKADLSALFRECPKCSRQNRLDMQQCEGCGYDIAAYYAQHERRGQVEALKDEDPVAAIELLEAMLRHGCESELEALIKELRGKQDLIQPWLSDAADAVSSGRREQALTLWCKVLTVIPRHRIALPEVRKACDQAVREGKATQAERDLAKAAERAQWALTLYPESSKAAALAKAVEKAQNTAQDLLASANTAIKSARFDDAVSELNRARETWPAVPGFRDTEQSLPRVRDNYNGHIAGAREAHTQKDLTKALKAAKAALEVCPNSKDGRNLVGCIEKDKSKAEKSIANSAELRKAADFDGACKQLAQAREIWPAVPKLSDAETELAGTRLQYTELMRQARHDLKWHKFGAAATACGRALSLCPDSPEAESLSFSIDRANCDARARRAGQTRAAKVVLKWLVIALACVVVLWVVWLGLSCFWQWLTGTVWPWVCSVFEEWGVLVLVFIGAGFASVVFGSART